MRRENEVLVNRILSGANYVQLPKMDEAEELAWNLCIVYWPLFRLLFGTCNKEKKELVVNHNSTRCQDVHHYSTMFTTYALKSQRASLGHSSGQEINK